MSSCPPQRCAECEVSCGAIKSVRFSVGVLYPLNLRSVSSSNDLILCPMYSRPVYLMVSPNKST